MSLNQEQKETKAELLRRIKKAQSDLEHEVTMYNTLASEAYERLTDTIELYNAVCVEAQEFIEDAVTDARDRLGDLGVKEAEKLSDWIRCWDNTESMTQSEFNSPEEVETDCDGFDILNQLPDSVEDL